VIETKFTKSDEGSWNRMAQAQVDRSQESKRANLSKGERMEYRRLMPGFSLQELAELKKETVNYVVGSVRHLQLCGSKSSDMIHWFWTGEMG
jgi:hypothetical protein